jgi:RNA 3'-terminal phosphate cyclase
LDFKLEIIGGTDLTGVLLRPRIHLTFLDILVLETGIRREIVTVQTGKTGRGGGAVFIAVRDPPRRTTPFLHIKTPFAFQTSRP